MSDLTKTAVAEEIKLARVRHGLSWADVVLTFDGEFLDYAWDHAEQKA